jgi:hypothetical protein
MGRGWFADYIAVTDNKTGEEACFFIGEYLNKENGGVEEKHLILDKQEIDNRPCRERQFDVNETTMKQSLAKTNRSSPFTQTYRVETKTGRIEFRIRAFVMNNFRNYYLNEYINRSYWSIWLGCSWYKCTCIHSDS